MLIYLKRYSRQFIGLYNQNTCFEKSVLKSGPAKSISKCVCVGGRGGGGWNFILLRPKFRCLMQNLLKKVLYKLLDGEVVKIRKQIKTKFTFH